MTEDNPATPAEARRARYDELLAAAVEVLTEAARLQRPVLERDDAASTTAGHAVWAESDRSEPIDWAEFVTPMEHPHQTRRHRRLRRRAPRRPRRLEGLRRCAGRANPSLRRPRHPHRHRRPGDPAVEDALAQAEPATEESQVRL